MGLLNQSISPDGIKSLVSTAYIGCWLGVVKDSYEKKSTLWCSTSHGKSGVVSSLSMSSSQWNWWEYKGSKRVILVIVAVWLSSGEEEARGMTQ
jgi:hypothetical protein